MNPVLTRPPSSSARFARIVAVILVSAIGLATLVAVSGLEQREGSYVRITIENPLPYLVNVEVTGATRDGWSDLATVGRGRTRVVEEVHDQGDEWNFRFTYGGVQAGELIMGRDQLANEGWKITVPTAVADRLRDAGLRESASSVAAANHVKAARMRPPVGSTMTVGLLRTSSPLPDTVGKAGPLV